ncbi:1-acylglycerol-3-phosphate O-acyltransferase [Photobacterium aphoticum]|uniref:1-acyl-sn-glycerol-3-phosphate acyltransferase n=1 Tax=Photobacterium aphoticum TaxID=754436 RepID=A0A0J1JF42_9GAMM|nr:1-acylglycerol-3-phosphate O-acyltransferase [Photobacterium aphoticum]KLV00297.1 acyl-phosphate glycerol 3-phosphate acyltransferase [Photobacterium aphoticum]PSU59562.1 1-acyl-sn-glycerol-3-phosphate acyltransferase [Photobacterium aphoticum]GHA39708.1 1-acyl-sn-glycerol-3-phosphate acyltransferase [Photobacterium aphoticum]
MLTFIRLFLAALFIIFMSLFALIYCCVFKPRDPKHVYFFCRWFNQLHKLIGLELIQRGLDKPASIPHAVYISNHQNVFDFVTSPGMLPPRTVSIGKKSLLWIPFFGQLYWITGNILIDRENKSKARDTIAQVVDAIHQRDLSIWMYPEGTRSKGRGLLPFKSGAFRMAIAAGVPIVPVCVSSIHNKISLAKRDNGVVIAEMLDPIDVSGYELKDARALADHCHQLMAEKIAALDEEVARIEQSRTAEAVKTA